MNRQDIADRFVAGKGYVNEYQTIVSGVLTGGTASSGFFVYGFSPSLVGTTLPGTVVGFIKPVVATRLMGLIQGNTTNTTAGWLVWLYKVGTVDLTATGDRLTHSAATFPVRRTLFGAADQPLSLLPMLRVTTAITTTTPVIRLRTAAGGTGYVNQAGTSVVGTRSMTLPLATAGTVYVPVVEKGDAAVRDVTAVEVTTAAAAGAADLWLAEFITISGGPIQQMGTLHDAVTAGLQMVRLDPAVAVSGTVESLLTTVVSGTTSRSFGGVILGVTDD